MVVAVATLDRRTLRPLCTTRIPADTPNPGPCSRIPICKPITIGRVMIAERCKFSVYGAAVKPFLDPDGIQVCLWLPGFWEIG
jgi:hypothetical protein